MSPSRRRRRASPEWEGRDVIPVAALPGRGLYVRHLGHPEGVDGVHRPTVCTPGSNPRPPAVFEAHWLAANLADVRVVHVHGLPARLSPAQIRKAVAATHAAGRPLVVTAYHLSDPAGADEAGFAAQLDALLPAADAVITLTEPARAEIAARWAVDATVLPHPHVVDFVRMRRERPPVRHNPYLIGADLGGLRLPGDPVAVVSALAEAVAAVPGTRLQVSVHEHLLDPGASRYDPAAIRQIERVVTAGGGAFRPHRPRTDAQLWDHLFGLDAAIVPPVFGSHSIWPEACFDLGTAAILPAGSHAAAQRPVPTYAAEGGVPNVASLAAAIAAAQREGAERADPGQRWKERVAIAEAHRSRYEKLISGRIRIR